MNKLLDRLSGVRRTGQDQWTARCPAHDDSSPSLAIKELSDGRILIHCHAGCGGSDVMESLGLSLGDLYPEGMRGDFSPNWHMRQARVGADRDRAVLALAESDRRNGKRLSPQDLAAERQAWLNLKQQGLI